jgi:hypothetical protein
LNNTYTTIEKDLKVALDQVDNFKTKMELFSSKYPSFKYNVVINKKDEDWITELNIYNNEEKQTQTS